MSTPERKIYTIETRLAKKRRQMALGQRACGPESSIEGPPLAKRRKRAPVKRKPKPVGRSDPSSDRVEQRGRGQGQGQGRGIPNKAAKKVLMKRNTPVKKRLPSKRAGAPRPTKKEQPKSKQATTKPTKTSTKTRKPKPNESITKKITNEPMDKTGAEKEAKTEPEKKPKFRFRPWNPATQTDATLSGERNPEINPEQPDGMVKNEMEMTTEMTSLLQPSDSTGNHSDPHGC
ncbi:GL22676 [Drosophila persimilis]|uniref:GL22676 n=1 Tax=Drosophila persimilis TaxID=7234 RepID=B4H017_DROPE|nr:GL22676 [Drosophila persimilis]